MDRCVFLVHRFCLGLFCAGEDVTRPHTSPRNKQLCGRAWSARTLRCAALGSRLAHHDHDMTWGGTMTDDGAMPRRASGNGGVVGSSITSGGSLGVGCSRR